MTERYMQLGRLGISIIVLIFIIITRSRETYQAWPGNPVCLPVLQPGNAALHRLVSHEEIEEERRGEEKPDPLGRIQG